MSNNRDGFKKIQEVPGQNFIVLGTLSEENLDQSDKSQLTYEVDSAKWNRVLW